MSFTSYAQNFEDVVLWRALKHVTEGRYIDVGAQHPIIDSVSKGFYEHGWRGVHVEPVPEYAALLRTDRPDEVVLELALSDRAGILEFSVFEGTGLSTAVSTYAKGHQEKLGFKRRAIQVPTLPMREAFSFLPPGEVHWLKIDVEGFEAKVLRGWDATVLRPWIVLFEATEPMSRTMLVGESDRILEQAGYRYAHFDGLNRFYVAPERLDLIELLRLPPNVFDESRLSGTSTATWNLGLLEQVRSNEKELASAVADADSRVRNAEDRAAMLGQSLFRLTTRFERDQRRDADLVRQANTRVALATQEAARLRHELHQVNHALHESASKLQTANHELHHAAGRAEMAEFARAAMLGSTSWRLSAPVRVIGAFRNRLSSAIRQGRLRSGLKRRVKSGARRIAFALVARPLLKHAVVAMLSIVPPLRRRIRVMLAPPASAPNTLSNTEAGGSSPATAVPPSAQSGLTAPLQAAVLSEDAQVAYKQLES